MHPEDSDQEINLSSLRRKWFTLAITTCLLTGAGYAGLSAAWQPDYAARWMGITTLMSAILLGNLWRNLGANHRIGETQIFASLGAGNLLSLARGLMIGGLAGFLFSPLPAGWLAWLPGLLYTLAATADLFDGYLARRANRTTRLGEILDLRLDGLGVLVACLLIVQYGQVPAWYLLVGLARYLFLAGIWMLKQSGRPIHELPPSRSRRPLAGAQMGFFAVALWPVFSPPATTLAAVLFAIPFLVGFTLDWLHVSGMNPTRASRPELSWRTQPNRFLTWWLPLILRLFVVAILVVFLTKMLQLPGQGSDLEIGLASSWLNLMIIISAAGLLLLALGAAGRVAALVVLFAAGIYLRFAEPSMTEILLIAGATALFFLGTGPFSLWTPEKGIIANRIGEVKAQDNSQDTARGVVHNA